jgi:hypothetical protein
VFEERRQVRISSSTEGPGNGVAPSDGLVSAFSVSEGRLLFAWDVYLDEADINA